jgi:uncharacterized repeat protein (TIGR01451 family)
MESTQLNCGLRIAGCGLIDPPIRNPKSEIRNQTHASRLPRWWRRGLVALATLLLCSCQAPTLRLSQLDNFVNEVTLPADSQHVVSDRDPATSGGGYRPPRPEIRTLDPSDLAKGRPIEWPASSSGPVACRSGCCPGAHGAADGSDGSGADAEALIGPSDEYLCDGGDFGLPAGVRADWSVDGLEQEDAVAHYDTLDGRVIVTPSNRVCIYAPRFAAVRRVEGVVAHERRQLPDVEVLDEPLAAAGENQPVATATQRHATLINRAERPPLLFRVRQQPGELGGAQAVIEAYNSLPVYANLEIIRTGQVDGSEQAELERGVQAAVTWSSDQAVQVVFENKQAVAAVGLRQPGVVYMTSEPNSPKLRLVKLASTSHALPGEEVEFTLRFDSVGDQVIGNVTIVDNLATRLEYVPDSAQSSVAANFSAVPNGAGSSVLRWEISDPLEPGDGGVLQFTVRVR